MSEQQHSSCKGHIPKHKGNKCKRASNIESSNGKPTYCEKFSKPPWTKPVDDRIKDVQEEPFTTFDVPVTKDDVPSKQYRNMQTTKVNTFQTTPIMDDTEQCPSVPDPCCPEPACVPQPKPKPKFKKRPVKPFATTDQLRDKIFSYIGNQPEPSPLRPFRGYRDDIVRQQLCCSDDLVTNPPDPCPPEDECEKWYDIIRTCNMEEKEAALCEVEKLILKMPCDLSEEEQLNFMSCFGASQNAICAFKEQLEAAKNGKSGRNGNNSCTCPPPQPRKPCPPSEPGTNFREQNPCQTQKSSPCPSKKTKKCQDSSPQKKVDPCAPCDPVQTKKSSDCKKAEPICKENMSHTEELAAIIDYCKQRSAETKCEIPKAPLEDELEDIQITESMTNINEANGEWKPDPVFGCEEEISDDDDEMHKYEDHRMFGGPDPPPKRTMKEEMKMYRQHIANIRKRYFGEVVKTIDDIEGITPDIAAAMVYSEELGMKIKSAPQTAYDYLYPEAPSQPVLNIGQVTGAAPKGIDDIVVPLAPPMFLTAAEFPGLEDPAMLDHPRILQVMPSMNLAEDPKASDTMAPNDICELVTGATHVNLMPLLFPEFEDMEQVDEEEEDDRFQVKLNRAIPPHFSQIQIRGTEPPNWFPGYFVALPSRDDVFIERRYGTVLEKVWEEVQPELVRPGGGATIIGT